MKNESIKIVKFNQEHAETLSNIIIRNLTEINTKDYPIQEMEEHALNFSPTKIKEYSKTRFIFVAVKNKKPVGTLSVTKDMYGEETDYVFLTIFVLPEFHGMGIGKMLVEAGEKYVRKIKGQKIKVPSSITAQNFYHKMGFRYINNSKKTNSDGVILMSKEISY